MNLKTFAIVLGTISSLAGISLVSAQAADTTRVRGTAVGFAGSTLTVKTREGNTDAITLAQGWKISGVAKASAQDIKQGHSSASRRSRKPMVAAARWKSWSFRLL